MAIKQLRIEKNITNREGEVVERYLRDISKEELITADEEVVLAERIRAGDEMALQKLVRANLRFVVSVAKQYQGTGLPLSDLINEGNIGLVKAASRYDETKGFKFISYAVWWIRQSIISAIAENTRIVRLPLNKISEINKIRQAKGALEQKLERQAEPQELSEYLNIPEQQIKDSMRSEQSKVSFDSPLGEDGTLLDVIPDQTVGDFDTTLMHDSLKLQLGQLLNRLSEKEKLVLELSFGLNEKKAYTLEEIGMKLGLTRERIRQIKKTALSRLKKSKKVEVFNSYL